MTKTEIHIRLMLEQIRNAIAGCKVRRLDKYDALLNEAEDWRNIFDKLMEDRQEGESLCE